jgi:hypothetical protein
MRGNDEVNMAIGKAGPLFFLVFYRLCSVDMTYHGDTIFVDGIYSTQRYVWSTRMDIDARPTTISLTQLSIPRITRRGGNDIRWMSELRPHLMRCRSLGQIFS